MAAGNIPDAVFDELKYETWSQMAHIRLVGKGVWEVVESGVPPDPTKIPELAATIKAEDLARWRDVAIKDMKALKIMQSSLTGLAFRKSVSVASAKDLWDMLKKGNEEAKFRRLEKEFQELTMYDGETTDFYSDRVADIFERARVSDNPNEIITKLMALGGFKFDEDTWMIHANATDHMTRHAKFFATLDRTHKGQVLLSDGRVIMAEGKGDVNVVVNGVKKTIKDVLFVPRINRNVLSVGQLRSSGYTVTMGDGECTIKDETGRVFTETMWEERGFVLRLQVIEGNRLTS